MVVVEVEEVEAEIAKIMVVVIVASLIVELA